MKLQDAHSEKKGSAREACKAVIMAAVLGILLVSNLSLALAQAYGVRGPRGGAAVRGPSGGAAVRTPSGAAAVRGPGGAAAVRGTGGTVVAGRSTVVVGGPVLPRGYIATLPHGYRPIYVTGVRYYTVGGVYYRPQMYGGRTVYVAVRL